MDNASAAMPVKPPTTPMLGATAQLTAVDGLRLGPRATAEANAKVHAPDNDVALVDAIRRGDAGSREALYHRFKRRVYALAVRIVGAGRRRGSRAGGLHPHLPRPDQVPRRRRAGDLDLPAGGERGAVAPRAPRRRPPQPEAANARSWRPRPARSRCTATRCCAPGSNGRSPACPSATGP